MRGVTCTQGMGAGTVEYLYAHSGSALNSYITTRIGAIGLNGPEGSCAHDEEAATAWSRVNAIDHRESGRSHAEGRVLCSDDPAGGRTDRVERRADRHLRARDPAILGPPRAVCLVAERAGPGELEEMSSMSTPTTPTMTDTSPTMSQTTMGG